MPRPPHPRDAGTALLPLVGTVLSVVGFVLLAVEVIRTLTGGILGTAALIVMWVGVGALVVGLVLLMLVVATAESEARTDGPAIEPAPGGSEPAVPTVTSAPLVESSVTGPLPPAAPPVETDRPADYAQPADATDEVDEAGHA